MNRLYQKNRIHKDKKQDDSDTWNLDYTKFVKNKIFLLGKDGVITNEENILFIGCTFIMPNRKPLPEFNNN